MSQERKPGQPSEPISKSLPTLVADMVRTHGRRRFHERVTYKNNGTTHFVARTETLQTPVVEIDKGGDGLVLVRDDNGYNLLRIPSGQDWNPELPESSMLTEQGETVMHMQRQPGGEFLSTDNKGYPINPEKMKATLTSLEEKLNKNI